MEKPALFIVSLANYQFMGQLLGLAVLAKILNEQSRRPFRPRHGYGARLLGPGGVRSVVAESVLVKQQSLILNRSRQRSPNPCFSDRLVAGLCALLIRRARLIRSAIVLKHSTLLSIHRL
jgi:hypothetical protein